MIVSPSRPARARAVSWLAWGIVPALLLLGAVDSRRLPTGGFGAWSTFFLVGTPAALVGVVLVLVHGGWRRTSATSRLVLAAFTTLLAVGCTSALTHTQLVHDRISDLGTITAPPAHILVPLASALVACLLGWVFATIGDEATLPRIVSAACWSLLGVVGIALARMTLRGELGARLNSAFAGSSSLHVALLLGLAGFVGLARLGVARTAHLFGAAGMLGALLLTGSRAGLLLAGLLVVTQVLALPLGRRAVAIRIGTAAGLVALGLLAVLVVPDLANRLTLVDEYRIRNAATGVAAWTQSPLTVLVGNGQGTLWPWMAYEHGLVPVVADWDLWTPWGAVLPSPHSTWLWALGELGLVGVLLLAVAALPAVLVGLRSRDPLAHALACGLALTLLALATDTHLVKVFPVAVVWWFATFVVVRRAKSRENQGTTSSEVTL